MYIIEKKRTFQYCGVIHNMLYWYSGGGTMDNYSEMLALVARAYNTTPEVIQTKIALAISDGQRSTDPQVRALWATIPRSGSVLTVNDFIEYLAQTLPRPYNP